jgi:hypothetical protein
MVEPLHEYTAQEICVTKRPLSVTEQVKPKRQYRRKTTLAPDRIPSDAQMTPAPILPEQAVQSQPIQTLQTNQPNQQQPSPPNKVNIKHRGKARRLPVLIKKSQVWNTLKASPANISLAEWLAMDPNAQKDIVDGIRYLRENKRRKDKQVRNPGVEHAQKVNKVDVNKEETESEDSDSHSSTNSDLETDTGVTSIVSAGDNEEDNWSDNDSDIRSVYRYPYSLERMKNSSPLKAMISIQGRPVEAVFDSGAAVSVIGEGLSNELGLIPNGDVLPLVGIDSGKKVTYSKIVMDVPLNLGGKLRPDHMTILEGNDRLCLIGIPFFQSFGVSIDLEKSTVHVPTTDGEVIIQGFTSHQPNTPVRTDDQVLPLIDTQPTVNNTKKIDNSNECYNVHLGNAQTDEYDDIFVPNNGDEKEEVKFTEDNIAEGVPLPLVDLLEEYKHIFSEVSGLGRVKNYYMDIELKPGATPIKSKAYRFSWEDQEELERSIQELLDLDVIEPSEGRYASPCFFIPKKTGEKRLVMDYRRLNQNIVQDYYPIPNIEELIDHVSGSTVMSSMDCTQGFFQLTLNPRHKEYTGFITPIGTFRYKVLPFGICLGPACYQRMMNTILKDYIGKFCVIFLDDVLCFSKNMEEHKDHLRLIFEACDRWNLRLKRKKSEFGKAEVEYLGQVISANGTRPCKRNIKKIRDLLPPTNVEGIRAILGLTGYYRKYCPDYSHYAEPLTRLTRKNVRFQWKEEQQEAFDYFKKILTSSPVLAIADKSMIQVVSVDSSLKALSCVLSQVKDTKTMEGEQVIAYASRTLRGPELNYSIHHLEALAVVWGINHFKHYLSGRRFLLISDHASLVYIFRPSKTTPKLNRWSAALLNYSFDIRYRAGKYNPADCLSRLFTQEDLDKMKNEN